MVAAAQPVLEIPSVSEWGLILPMFGAQLSDSGPDLRVVHLPEAV
jgi:hypothetical protein